MKNLFVLCILFLGYLSYSQVGIGTNTPDPAAVLDINSEISSGVYGGLKLPTMTIAERATIATPIPDGLMIYILDGVTRCVQVYDATQSMWMDWYCMNQLPVASAVNYTGTTDVGQILTGNYTYTDLENDTESGTSFQWYTATDISGTGRTPIVGATSSTYTTTATDGNQFIAFGVTPLAASGASPGVEVLSTYQQISFLQTLVEFGRNATTIPESDFRTIPITVINPNPSIATTVEIALDAGNTSSFGVLGTAYTVNNGANVTSYPFTVTIPAGATTANFTIAILEDDTNAINEELFLELQNPNGGTNATLSGTQDDHRVFSDDNDLPTELEFTTTSSSVEEPVALGNTSTINVSIVNESSLAATTVLVSLNGTSNAEAGDYTIDYDGNAVTFPFTITFPAGQTADESFTITALDDAEADDETLSIELITPAGGTATAILGTNDAYDLTINDDDLATVVEFAATTFTIDEDDIDTITINLINPSLTVPTTVEIALAGSSTAAGAGVDFDIDYSSTTVATYPFTVTFPVGVTSQTIDLFTFDDANTVDETLVLNLQNIAGGFNAQFGTNATNTVTISDDDTPAGPVLIGIQDFEAVPATPVMTYTEDGGFITTGNGPNPTGNNFSEGARGYEVSNDLVTMNFSSISASGYTDASLSFRLASFGSATNGNDTADYVDVLISTDGGINYSNELRVNTSGPNMKWSFDATGVVNHVYDGDNTPQTYSSGSGNTFGLSFINLTGITAAADVRLRLVLKNNNSNEDWIIDDIRMYGN